jgi:hypothetical protein
MFSPIIRSTWLYLQYLVVSPKLLPAGVLDELKLNYVVKWSEKVVKNTQTACDTEHIDIDTEHIDIDTPTEGVHQKRKYQNQYPHPHKHPSPWPSIIFRSLQPLSYIFFHRRCSPAGQDRSETHTPTVEKGNTHHIIFSPSEDSHTPRNTILHHFFLHPPEHTRTAIRTQHFHYVHYID